MEDINALKVKIFDLLRQIENLQLAQQQLVQQKNQLVKLLEETERKQKKEKGGK